METNAEEPRRKPTGHRAPERTENGAPSALEITPQERLRMAECCAFFKAEKYREAEPGKIRSTDIESAKAQIEAVIAKCGEANRSGDR